MVGGGRRKRGRLWATVYLAVFEAGDDADTDADGETGAVDDGREGPDEESEAGRGNGGDAAAKGGDRN